MVILVASIAAVVLATAAAMVLLRFSDGTQHALLRVHTARPWFIAAQVATLGLAWHQWPRIVAAIARWRALAPARHEALLRARTRIFVLLAAFELLIVLRALAA